jgi:hypothetical protein
VRLAAREVVLRTVKLLRSEVCSASVWAHFTSLLHSKYFTMATAIASLGASHASLFPFPRQVFLDHPVGCAILKEKHWRYLYA